MTGLTFAMAAGQLLACAEAAHRRHASLRSDFTTAQRELEDIVKQHPRKPRRYPQHRAQR